MHLFRSVKSHPASECAIHSQCNSSRLSLQEMGRFIVKVCRPSSVRRVTRLSVGRVQTKILLTHALYQPVFPAFVRNEPIAQLSRPHGAPNSYHITDLPLAY